MSFRITFTAIKMTAKMKLPAAIREELRAYTKDYTDDVIGEMLKGYDTPARGDYVRTGRYGTYMVSKNTSSGGNIQYTITDPVQDPWGRYYAGYVGGSNQASFHAGIWPKFSDVIKRKRFDRGVQKIITAGLKGL